MLPADPRLAIAGAIPATMVGLGALRHGPTVFALSLAVAAPGVLAFTVARARSLRRAARGR
jgi:hypothetical protein